MMLGALIDLIGIASGNLENLSIMVNRYSAPELDLGKGPTISITMCSKGSPTDGIGNRGALGMLSFGFPTTWH